MTILRFEATTAIPNAVPRDANSEYAVSRVTNQVFIVAGEEFPLYLIRSSRVGFAVATGNFGRLWEFHVELYGTVVARPPALRCVLLEIFAVAPFPI